MKLREGFYGALDVVCARIARGQAADLDGELDCRGVSDPRSRTLAWDVCQAAAQAQAIREGRAGSSTYVAYDHRLRRHIATHLEAGSADAQAMTQKADGFLASAVAGASVRRPAVLVPIPRRAGRAEEEVTFTGTAA